MTTNDQYPSSGQFGTVEEAKAYVKVQKMWQYKYTPIHQQVQSYHIYVSLITNVLVKFNYGCQMINWMYLLEVTTNTIMPQDLYKIFHQIKKKYSKHMEQ